MKRFIYYAFIILMVNMVGVFLSTAAQVSQGKCIVYDSQKQLLTMEEYDLNFSPQHRYGQPTGKQAVYNVQNAKIGIPPAVGDILRIAYELKGDERIAIKIMNVSKQDLMKRK